MCYAEAAVEWILQNIHKIKELELNMDNEIGEHQHTKSIESQSDDFSVVGVEVPDLEVRQSAFDNKDAETADDILTKEEIPDMMISVKSVNNDSLWKRFINIIIGKK